MTGPHTDRSKIAQRFETDVVEPMDDFDDPSQESAPSSWCSSPPAAG